LASGEELGPGLRKSLLMALTAVFTALVCVATVMFVLYVPATEGYFNLGETMVYTTALLLGPYVGAIAGGLGSALADVFLGFPIYAPATLVIKGAEGFVVGFLAKRGARLGEASRRYLAIGASLLAGSLLGSIGAHYYSGEVAITVGLGERGATTSAYVPVEFWVFAGTSTSVLIMALSSYLEPEAGWHVLAILCGGSLMVLGYFAYESFLMGVVAATLEVPVNIGQVAVGLAVALPLTRALGKRFSTVLGTSGRGSPR